MILIKEEIKANESIYSMLSHENNKTELIRTIYFYSTTKEFQGTQYTIVYDEYMNPIEELFQFLNYENYNVRSINTRDKALRALKLLYVYQEIISKRINEFNYNDFKNLSTFLSGISPKGLHIKFELITHRNSETINGYLAIYRKFVDYHGYETKYLLIKSGKYRKLEHPDTEVEYRVQGYKINENIPKKYLEVPRYISVDEFSNIIRHIRENYTIQEEVIIRLMYENGLRIGEVLGLTFDDIIMVKVNGVYSPMIFIRNRVSDEKYQLAKTCMKINNINQYKTEEYKTNNYGYQKIVFTESLYEAINVYIEQKHSMCLKKHPYNYSTFAKADRVRQAKKFEPDNYYIFLNSLGKKLSQTLWNETLRKIFTEVGLVIDHDIKKHNINHRFRHGFAMFNVKYLNTNMLELKEKLRHRSLQSVLKYYKPTTSDAIELKTKFADTLSEIFPGLINKGEAKID